MSKANVGNTVKVKYTGILKKSGTVFEQTPEDNPLSIKLGNNEIIPKIEDALIGMDVGETKTVELQPEDAFGERHEEMMIEIDKDRFPDNVNPEVGQSLELKLDSDEKMNVMVKEITDSTVKVDGNHPLAGESLVFELKLVDVA